MNCYHFGNTSAVLTHIQNGNQSDQERINIILDSLLHQSEQLQNYLVLSKKQRKREKPQFLSEHQLFLRDIIDKLRNVSVSKSTIASVPHSSTPYRNNENKKPRPFSIGSPLGKSGKYIHEITFFLSSIFRVCMDSIHVCSISVDGAEINKSYLEKNRSDWTIGDVSTWLHLKSQNATDIVPQLESKSDVSPGKIDFVIPRFFLSFYFHEVPPSFSYLKKKTLR